MNVFPGQVVVSLVDLPAFSVVVYQVSYLVSHPPRPPPPPLSGPFVDAKQKKKGALRRETASKWRSRRRHYNSCGLVTCHSRI